MADNRLQLEDKLDKMNSILAMMVEEKVEETKSWSEIGELVRKGLASDVFSIGDQLVTTWTDTATNTEYTVPMDIVHFGDVTLGDGEEVPGMFLQWHYTTPFGVQFDPAEPYNTLGSGGVTDANVASYGYNRWSQSGVRQWLNSAKSMYPSYVAPTADEEGTTTAGWWTSQHSKDVAPDIVKTKNGFLSGFSDDFLAQLKPVKVITQTNTVTDSGVTDTTYDTFFLPSKNEEFLTVQASISEGSTWEYWKRAYNGTRPVNYQNGAAAIRYSVANHASARTVWLRSAVRGDSYNEWLVYSHGYVDGSNARNAFTLAPACVIC